MAVDPQLSPSTTAHPRTRPHGGAPRPGVAALALPTPPCLWASPRAPSTPGGLGLATNPALPPWGGFLGRLGSGSISPQISCQIPPLGPGPRELLRIPYFLSLEIFLLWICSLPASGPPASSHLSETLETKGRAVPCLAPPHFHLSQEIFRNQMGTCCTHSWRTSGEPRR